MHSRMISGDTLLTSAAQLYLLLTLAGTFSVSLERGNVCIENAYFKSFSIQHPVDHSHVPGQIFLRLSAEVFDVPWVNEHNDQFSVCVYLDDSLVMCDLSVFDEIEIAVSKPGIQTLAVDLHLRNIGVICSASAVIHCCHDDDSVNDAVKAADLEEKVADMVEFTQRQLKYLSALPPPPSAPCPWCCPKVDGDYGGAPVMFGIKSAAAHISQREAIRASWLSELPVSACAFFIVGDIGGADGATNVDADDLLRMHAESVEFAPEIVLNATLLYSLKRAVLAVETNLYGGDVLQSPTIDAIDSYDNLVYKTALFLKFAHWRKFPPGTKQMLQHVVVVDDDVYVRTESLLLSLLRLPEQRTNFAIPSPSWEIVPGKYAKFLRFSSVEGTDVQLMKKFYAGEVFAERLHHNIKPQRNPLHRNFLSDSDYTMDILPPFVAGNFIVMSSDLVAFVAKNFDDFLQPIGSLEDVTLAVWFQAMKVLPLHIPGVIKMGNAGHLPFALERAMIDSFINGDGLLNSEYTRCHPCSLDHITECTANSSSVPVLAIYNVKTPELFQILKQHIGIAEVKLREKLGPLLEEPKSASSTVDLRCLHTFLIDASLCRYLELIHQEAREVYVSMRV